MDADKAREVLIEIKKFFDNGEEVSGGALLFGDDRTLREHVDEALEESVLQPTEIVVTRRRKIAKNYYGNWVGFEGKRKVKDFGKQEEQARQWLWGV